MRQELAVQQLLPQLLPSLHVLLQEEEEEGSASSASAAAAEFAAAEQEEEEMLLEVIHGRYCNLHAHAMFRRHRHQGDRKCWSCHIQQASFINVS